MDLYVLSVAILSLTGPTLANTLVLSRRQPEKKNRRFSDATTGRFPREMTSEEGGRNYSKLAKSLPKPLPPTRAFLGELVFLP